MANESDKNLAALRMYINDMLALQKHILEAVSRQIDDENLKGHGPAAALAANIRSTLTQQVSELQTQVSRLGSETGATIKQAVSSALGALAGVYDKVRKDPVSRMLRDDYTALCLATISYTQLHTTGLAFGDQAVADLALRHLEGLTPLVMQINQVMPGVVTEELKDEGNIDTSAVGEATENTQQAWKPS